MAEATTIDPMERLISGLPKLVPKQDRTTIVHGDYRLDNMILHQSRPEILAIIDWELSTLGDPLADLAWFLMAWILPASERASFRGADIGELGIPNIEEVIDRYCQLTGRTGIENIDWLLAFTLFRLAAICQGISRRTQQGLANNSHALSAAQRVPILANCAMHFASKAEA
jgi:aminoglycoside phosphotransferase (APT) family kinase protein